MGDDKASIGAMAAAAAALISGIGALTLTGALGRVQRNQGLLFTIGLGLVVLGAAAWVIGSLISSDAREWKPLGLTIALRPGLQGVGVAASLLGLVFALGAAIATANDTERPSLKLTLDDDGDQASGTATVSNLNSTDQLTVLVDGLEGSGPYTPTILFEAHVGPDSDGKATVEAKVRLPEGLDAVGIRAWTTDDAGPCGRYRRDGESNDGATGCIILQLP